MNILLFSDDPIALDATVCRLIDVNPGTVQAMISGWVTRAWLKKQHPKWLKEMEHEGTLIVSDGKK
jgi:uncharacterized protein (DUF362 family)